MSRAAPTSLPLVAFALLACEEPLAVPDLAPDDIWIMEGCESHDRTLVCVVLEWHFPRELAVPFVIRINGNEVWPQQEGTMGQPPAHGALWKDYRLRCEDIQPVEDGAWELYLRAVTLRPGMADHQIVRHPTRACSVPAAD